MYNPSELEGEVDHSFFDSDGDDGNINHGGIKKTDKEDNPPAHKGSRTSILDCPTGPRSSSSSPKGRRSRASSTGTQDSHSLHTDDSNDTVTDVSPLSSPDSSRLQSLDLNDAEAEEGSVKGQESVPFSGLSNIRQDEDSDQEVDEYSLGSESRLEDGMVIHCPGGRNRKNYSFTNDEVRRIDRENQRLLRQLSRLSSGSRPGTAPGQKRHVTSNPPLARLSHSALNRQREQQRIERENLAFLKRLESVKPTHGLKRSQQLADYQRLVGYLGPPSYTIYQSNTKTERPTSRTSSASLAAAAHCSSTAISSTPESSSRPSSKSRKPNAARPAWC